MSQEKRVEKLEQKVDEADEVWTFIVDWTPAGQKREPVGPDVVVVEWDDVERGVDLVEYEQELARLALEQELERLALERADGDEAAVS